MSIRSEVSRVTALIEEAEGRITTIIRSIDHPRVISAEESERLLNALTDVRQGLRFAVEHASGSPENG